MRHWILKTEPSSYSWDDLVREKKTVWTGVRNHAAAKNLRAMSVGDLAFVYHSGAEKAALGVAKVTKAAFQDPTTREPWVAVEIAAVGPLARVVSLGQMKADPLLKGMQILRQGRLSVSEVAATEWKRLLTLGGRVE